MDADAKLKQWAREAVKKREPIIKDATIFTAIVTDNFLKNPLCALEVGLAVLMDKPIFIIVDNADKVPAHLVKIARVIERVDTSNAEEMRRVSENISKLADQVEAETNGN